VQASTPQGLAPAARLVVEELAFDKAQHQAGLASPHVTQQDQLGLLDAANPGPFARHVANEGCPDAAGQLGGECSPQAGQKVLSSGACWRSAATLALEPIRATKGMADTRLDYVLFYGYKDEQAL